MIKKTLIKLVVLFALMAVLIPLIVIFIWSFSSSWPWPLLKPQSFSLRAVHEIFGLYSGALTAMLISLAIGLITASAAVIISIPAARALVLYDFCGKAALQFLLLFPVAVPAAAFAMGVQVMFK